MQSRLPQTAGKSDTDVLAIMLAFLIWKQIDVSSPIGGGWSTFVARHPTAPEEINRVMDRLLDAELPTELLLASYNAGSASRDLISAVMQQRVQRGRLGRLNPGRVLGNLYQYSWMMPYALREKFANQLTSYQSFWPNIKSLPWSPNIFQLATLIEKQGGDAAKRIKAELLDRILHTSEAEWKAAIETRAEPFQTATRILPADITLGVHSALVAALVATATESAGGDKLRRSRWFELTKLLTVPARRKAIAAMGTALLERPPADKLKLVKAGGARFMGDVGFAQRSDAAMAGFVIPLARSGKGRAWLRENAGQIRSVIDAAGAEQRSKLTKLIDTLARSNVAEERGWAEKARRNWGLTET